MKKALLSSLLLSTMIIGATTANAADDAKEASAAERSATTDVTVDLTKDDGHDKNVPGVFKDTLSIVYKPTSFQFTGFTSENALQLKNEHLRADNQFIVVNDDRKETNGDYRTVSNWELKGELSEIKNATTSLSSKLTIKPTELKTYSIADAQGNVEEVIENGVVNYNPAPVDYASGAAASSSYTLNQSIVMNAAAGSTTVASANAVDLTATTTAANRGVVTGLGDATLNISNGTEVGAYAGTITWTLADSL